MKSENDTNEQLVQTSENGVRPSTGKGKYFAIAKMHMAGPLCFVVGYTMILACLCSMLVWWGCRNSDVSARLAYRLHHFYNCPAWFCFGTLETSMLVLVALLIALRSKIATGSVDCEEGPFTTTEYICLILVINGLMMIGEAAMQMAIAGGW